MSDAGGNEATVAAHARMRWANGEDEVALIDFVTAGKITELEDGNGLIAPAVPVRT